MAVGQGYIESGFSYVALGREIAWGTGVTTAAGLEFLSASVKTMVERKTLEEVNRRRDAAQGISTSKKCTADLEFYFRPELDACGFLLQNAFGGTVTSATATGETVGAAGMTHTFNVGDMDQSYPSLSLTVRKGGSTTGKVFQYVGLRVNDIGFHAEIDDALKCSVKMIAKDSTVGATDVESLLTVSAADPLVFTGGRLSVETAFNSLTSASFWHVQSIELGMNNSLKADNGSRRIGSNILDVLPVGKLEVTLKAKIRFDTTTAYDAMIAATQFSAELEFLGTTLSSSAVRKALKFTLPKVFIKDAGDPEIGGPDGVLTSQVTFQVLRDETQGYSIQAKLTNAKANYA